MMMRQHHIALSRGIAGLMFALSLVLTPRAWVESEAEPLMPLEDLEKNEQCLDCNESVDCSDAPATKEQNGLWLNPDEPLPQSRPPCIVPKGSSPGS